MRPPNHPPDLPALQPHQVREVRVVLALVAQRGVERGRRVSVLPLQQWRQQRGAAGAAQAAHAGAAGQQPRRQAQAAALLVPPWQPAQLPGDEEGDGEEDDATEGDDDRQQTDTDLCRGRRDKQGLKTSPAPL